MQKRARQVRVRVRWYSYERRTYGDVEIGVLKITDEEERVEHGSPIEVLLSVIEELSKTRKGDYFEVQVDAPGIVEVMGENPKYRGQRLLFPRPSRLYRVGILSRDKLSSLIKDTGGDYASFKLDDLEWYVEKDEIYVYEGVLNAGENVVAVYLDTSMGPRMIIPSGRDRILQDVLSHPQSSGE